ncbi:MAG: hypothetical protein RLZZ500_1905 [Bacteroidota bacterium]|jgi:hypothetical protein
MQTFTRILTALKKVKSFKMNKNLVFINSCQQPKTPQFF